MSRETENDIRPLSYRSLVSLFVQHRHLQGAIFSYQAVSLSGCQAVELLGCRFGCQAVGQPSVELLGCQA